jgi:hypothetical protein
VGAGAGAGVQAHVVVGPRESARLKEASKGFLRRTTETFLFMPYNLYTYMFTPTPPTR